MLLARELKSVALVVLVLLVADTNAAPKTESKILVPLKANTRHFVYSNPKPIRKYIEGRLTMEIKQLDKGKSKLKGKARKQAVLRSRNLKRGLAMFKKKNVIPNVLRKDILDQGIGFVDTENKLTWVRVVTVINDREFIATIGYQKVSIQQIGTSRAIRTTRTNVQGTTPFRFIGFDTNMVRENDSYQLLGFFKTTATTVEPFVPDN